MSNHAFRQSPVGTLLPAVAVTLSLTAGYIHLTLGSVLFTLNAAGYVALAVLVIIGAAVSHPMVTRFAWLPDVGLAGYAAVTIAGYLIIGPYFALGWVAKAGWKIVRTINYPEAN